MNKTSRTGASSSSSTAAANNNANSNYYGFSSSSSSSPSSSNNANNVGAVGAGGGGLMNDNEINGGGLSFVIHSSSNQNQNNNNSNNNNQLPSISSVGSSASSTTSGISSGSSTITKSSTFNGNTFTRSKPKERKPIPNAWASQEIEDHHHHHLVENQGAVADAGPFLLKGKGIIPSVTLSEATPSPTKSKEQKEKDLQTQQDLYYFDTSNSNSSGGSVVLAGRKSNSFNSGSGSGTHDQSFFEPRACSTFILTENEEFLPHGEDDISGDNSSAIVINKIRGKNGIRKMKGDISSSSSSSVVRASEDKQTSSSDGSSESPNGSSSGSGGASAMHSQFSGEEEILECFGDGTESFTFQDSTSGSGEASLQYSRDGADLVELSSSGGVTGGGSGSVGGSSTPLSRNSWTRTSLRKSPQNNNSSSDAMGYRRWGSFRNAPGTKRTPPAVTSSNALANQLYRSSSFHSSGRSSAGDAEEMYSDGSLEDEVSDLTHKVHHLEEKMNVLAENQIDTDDRYTREKEKNAELSTKVFMLEEQLRETEFRGDEKLKEEQRRLKEFQSRCDREKQLQSENYEIRLQSMEKDLNSSKTEGQRLKNQVERERGEKENLGEKLFELERELGHVREENRLLQEQARKDREQLTLESQGAQQTLMDLKREMESMRQFQMQNSPSSLRSLRNGSQGDEGLSLEEELMQGQELKGRVKEFEEEIRRLKRLNKQLQESNDELNAQLLNRGLEEGRTLLTTINSVPAGDSLAAEFEAMSTDQTALGLYADSETDLAKVKKALKEQIEVNEQLRSYIDGILLIIVENNPQLLEVKNHNNNSTNNGSSSNTKTSIANPNCAVAPLPEQQQEQVSTATAQQPSNKVNFSNGLAKISFSSKK